MLESGLFSRKRETLAKNVDVNGKDFLQLYDLCKHQCLQT